MKLKKDPYLGFALILTDILFVVLADLTSFIIRFNGRFPEKNFIAYQHLLLFIILLRLGAFYIYRLYDNPKYKSAFEIFVNTVKAASLSSITIVCVLYFLDIESYPRLIAALSWLITIVYITLWRLAAKPIVALFTGKDYFHAHLLIVGTNKHASEAAVYASRDASTDYSFVGFVAYGKTSHIEVDRREVLGTLDDINAIMKMYPVDKIIIAEPVDKKRLLQLAAFAAEKEITVQLMPYTYEAIIGNVILCESAAPFISPVIFTRPTSWYHGLKRILDIILSLVLLVLTSPIWLVSVIAIRLTSPGAILYLQKRTGLNGSRFTMLKLRTMAPGAEKAGHPRWAKKDDARITPVGTVLRRYRIDEIPQLVNVLRNEMSLIGPRPERPYFTSKLIRKIPFYAERLRAKPGITGWAQVSLQYADSEAASESKLLYDLFYIQNMSVALDGLILLKTFKVVVAGQGAH